MISRRNLLTGVLGIAGLGALAACTRDRGTAVVTPNSTQVAAAEAARNPGRIRQVGLAPAVSDIDLGGVIVSTWTYGGKLPGQPVHVTAGEQLKATVLNRLPADTSVHWHGLALRNDADGVPHITQDPISPETTYTYQFTAGFGSGSSTPAPTLRSASPSAGTA